MAESEGGRLWKSRTSRAIAELMVIFVGVTAAFVVEGYRERANEAQDLRQATEGILAELARYQVRAVEHADSIDANIDRWKAVADGGRRGVPGYYRIPGAPYPPTAAWDAAVASGVASMFEPELRLALGYFYAEFTGIHDNYVRHLTFIEDVIMPAAERGVSAFYDSAGDIRAEFQVYMTLMTEFAADLRRIAELAALLEEWLRFGNQPAEDELALSNEIVEADELARQSEAAGGSSYRTSAVKVLDGLAAKLQALATVLKVKHSGSSRAHRFVTLN